MLNTMRVYDVEGTSGVVAHGGARTFVDACLGLHSAWTSQCSMHRKCYKQLDFAGQKLVGKATYKPHWHTKCRVICPDNCSPLNGRVFKQRDCGKHSPRTALAVDDMMVAHRFYMKI